MGASPGTSACGRGCWVQQKRKSPRATERGIAAAHRVVPEPGPPPSIEQSIQGIDDDSPSAVQALDRLEVLAGRFQQAGVGVSEVVEPDVWQAGGGIT